MMKAQRATAAGSQETNSTALARIAPGSPDGVIGLDLATLPPMIASDGNGAAVRFAEFFTVSIRNANTRAAYGRAVGSFLRWCAAHHVHDLRHIQTCMSRPT